MKKTKRQRVVINRSVAPSTAYGLKLIAQKQKTTESRAIDYLVDKELAGSTKLGTD